MKGTEHLDVQLVYYRGFNECRASRWVNNPSEANIVGGDGLPLPPLRTDDWPLESAGRRYGR